jgi:hypothetical protein
MNNNLKCYKHTKKEANYLWTEGKQYLAICQDCADKLPEPNLNNHLYEIYFLNDDFLDEIEKLIVKG